MLVTGTVAVVALRVTTNHLDRIARDLSGELIQIERLRFEAERIVSTNRGYLLTADPRTAQRATRSIARMEDSVTRLEAHVPLAPGLDVVDKAARRYVAAANAVAEQRTKTDDPRLVLPVFETTVADARDHLERVIGDFVAREQAAFDHESAHAHDVAQDMQAIVIAATILGIALSAALARLWIKKLGAQFAAEREATIRARTAVAARDDVLAIVSHDLRNPLTTIAVGANLLEMDPAASPLAKKHTASITTAVGRMRSLIDELLESAQLEAGKLELQRRLCVIGPMFDSLTALFAARAQEANVALAIDAGDLTEVEVEIDRKRILQALENLIGNAFNFTPSGGQIAVTARTETDHVRVEVRDNGTGIEAAQVPHLFERYWQGHSRTKGSLGLGLYICKQIVAAHGGQIGVDTTLGNGTTFWFTIPRA
jgi:signal transduction histidine kinase